jgi:serine protease Do
VTVRLTDGSEYSAALVGKDAASDLAVIKIDPADKKLTVASFGCSGDLVVGEDVIAIGNPLGSLGGTLTTGIISATERNIYVDGEQMVLLQTNAAINPGNSGGGLFNMAGKLVGIVNAKAAGEDIEGLGFAIPVDHAHTVIEDLINYGYVRGIADHGLVLLDVNSQNLPYAYQKYGITTVGVVLIGSQYGGEFEYGDVVIAVNGVEISSSHEVDLAVKAFSVGDSVTFTVARDGRAVNVSLTLREKVPESVSFN